MTTVKGMMPVVLSALLAMAVAGAAHAGEEKRPAIMQIDLYIENGYLTGDITSRGVFSERIIGTVQSGLPAVVQLFYHLTESSGRPVQEGVHSYSLEYDVWDDVYSVTWQDSTVLLPSLEAMRSMIEHMKSITLAPVERMLPQRSYSVQMSIAVNPLQGTDSKEMTGWVMQNVGRRGSSWHEQVFSVNDLIEHFFSSEEDLPMRSEWFRSAPFKPHLLSARDREEG